MNPSSQIQRNLELNNCFASVFHDSVNYTIPDQLNELSIKMIILDFYLFDILLLLEPTDYFSATGDELPSFLFNQWSNFICSPDFELLFWMVQIQYGRIFSKQHASLPYINLVNIMILLTLSLISYLYCPLLHEKLLFNFIYPKIRHQIKSEQHGFMKSLSTKTQMIMYLDSVYSACGANSPAIPINFKKRRNF